MLIYFGYFYSDPKYPVEIRSQCPTIRIMEMLLIKRACMTKRRFRIGNENEETCCK